MKINIKLIFITINWGCSILLSIFLTYVIHIYLLYQMKCYKVENIFELFKKSPLTIPLTIFICLIVVVFSFFRSYKYMLKKLKDTRE